MIRVEDLGELGYGGVVTLTDWWDEKRIASGKLAANAMWKKYSTWSYLGIGLVATLMSAFGWMRRYDNWTENISHGFIYGLPGFVRTVIKSTGTAGRPASGADAIAQANAILAARREAARQIAGGGQATQRTYEKEFQATGVL